MLGDAVLGVRELQVRPGLRPVFGAVRVRVQGAMEGGEGHGFEPNDYYLKGFHTTAVVAGWGGTGGPTGDAWAGMREGAGEGEGR